MNIHEIEKELFEAEEKYKSLPEQNNYLLGYIAALKKVLNQKAEDL